MSVTQRLWSAQGHPCCLNKALCHGGVTAGRARLLPHGVRKGRCVCVGVGGCAWWGMCSHAFIVLSLLLTNNILFLCLM